MHIITLKEVGQLSLYSDGARTGRTGFFSCQGKKLSKLHSVHTGSVAHPTTYPSGKTTEA
jgi:hypothetical protein